MDTLAQRVAPLALPTASVQPLLDLAGRDLVRLSGRAEIAQIVPTVTSLLGGDEKAVSGFAEAWLLMYAAIQHLDHLQDNDPITDECLRMGTTAVQYNRVLTYYILATSLLDTLAGNAAHILQLRQFWTDSMLHMALGQQHDLVGTAPVTGTQAFERYQQIVQAKTGATFALAFGGPALLLGAAPLVFDDLRTVGILYGTLLQFRDDIRDREGQQQWTLTLPHLLATVPIKERAGIDSAEAFWAFLYPHYHAAIREQLAGHSSRLRHGVLDLVTRTFGDV